MSSAINGHGALIAMEKDGDPAGTFTTIAELNGPIARPELSRESEEITPHQDTISSHVFAGRILVGPITFSMNYIFNGGTHDHLTGLQKRLLDGDTFGLRIRGPSGAASSDEWIMSGQITSFGGDESPVRTGARTVSCTFQPSGAVIIDGASQGTVS